jgi:hypothetical protein
MRPDKWEFMRGDEVVYSSALDFLGKEENVAWNKCIPVVAKVMGRWGWDRKLSELDEGKIRELIYIVVLEFEKNFKEEKLNTKEDLF